MPYFPPRGLPASGRAFVLSPGESLVLQAEGVWAGSVIG
jgi:hypothetical protein